VENFTIEVQEREALGKFAAHRARRAGALPGVAYHKGEEPVAVQVPYKEFVMLASRARRTQVFTFKSDSKKLGGKMAIVKEIQRDYIKNRVLHVDFQTLKENEELLVDVPVKLVGESPGVKNQNGIMMFVTHEVTVMCLPKNIPAVLEVDISNLNLGESIHAGDVVLPTGVALKDDAEETIVSVVASRAGEEAAASAEGTAAAAKAPAGKAPAAKAPAAKAPAGKK
jgi:large subunit ribosomal protein L25